MRARIHMTLGGVALFCILGFWISTAVAEIFYRVEVVAAVKRGILYAVPVLVLALMATAASGFLLAGNREGDLLNGKRKRMPFIAGIGLFLMIPSAIFLYIKADAGELDTFFYLVQGIELMAGAMQVLLIGKSMRDGLRMTGRLRIRNTLTGVT